MSQGFDNWFHIARQGFVHCLTGILNDDLRLCFIFFADLSVLSLDSK